GGNLYPLVYPREEKELGYIFRYLLNLRGDFKSKELDLNKTAFLPDKGGYYPNFTGIEQFDIFEKLYNDFSREKARELVYEFKIPLERKLKELPDFQRRIISIAAILATKQKLLFLEEPLTNLPGSEASLLQYIFEEELKDDKAILLTLSRDKIERYNFNKYYFLKKEGIELKDTKKEIEEKKDIEEKIKKIPVWDEEKAFLVDHKDIKWISTYKGKSTLHTGDNEYNVNLLLRELEERLDFPPFFRCHRSYIINLNYIEEVVTWFNGTYNLKIADEEIPVSRSNVKELEEILGI
ncbi:MAG: LytTR family transcriptional regulator DNA-binding domain-containing protein, partial [Bacillota bacterium]